ncbi:MAG: hypothetical protein KAI63_08650 [Planctomycetes bacterium]|nr:hypothetical protein [Planctomycetota bacterium]
MIQINLLPIERRRKEKTPLPRFLILIAGVIACLLLGVWNIHGCSQLKQAEKQRTEKTQERDQLKVAVAPYQKLQAEEAGMKARKKSIDSVLKTRTFLWWQAVDCLWEVICEYNTIWLTSFEAKGELKGLRREKSQPLEASITFKAFSAGQTVDKVSDFRTRLKTHQGSPGKPGVADIFDVINEPFGYKLVKRGGDEIVQFNIDLRRWQNREKDKEKK